MPIIADILSGTAAAGSIFTALFLLINWYRSLPRVKVDGIWRDPSANIRPRGEGETDNDGNYRLSLLIKISSHTSTELRDCYVHYKTDVQKDYFLDWGAYMEHLGRGENDTFGAGTFKIFTLPPYSSKILRGGVICSSGNAPLNIRIVLGGKEIEKTIDHIASLEMAPSQPPF